MCKHVQNCKGVKYLPYDVSVLSEIMKTNGTTSMAFCCRCHDEVPSFSWCFTCLSPLCEFHHQDHRLSIDTRIHRVLTFQDIWRSKKQIQSALPPMACPESLGHDCSLFCKTCGYMISAQAMIQFHKGHNVVDIESIYAPCVEMLQSSSVDIQRHIGELMLTYDVTKNSLSVLERNSDLVETKIHESFEMLRSVLTKREESLKAEVNDYFERNRCRLIKKLDKITDALDICHHMNMKVDKVLNLSTDISAEKDFPTKCRTEGQGALKNDRLKNMIDAVSKEHTDGLLDDQGLLRNNLKPSKSYVISSTKVIKDRCECILNECGNLLIPLEEEMKYSLDNLKFFIREDEIAEICCAVDTIGTIWNEVDEKPGSGVLNSEDDRVHGVSIKVDNVLEDRYKFLVQKYPQLNRKKGLIVDMKTSQVNPGNLKSDESGYLTVGKITIEMNLDHVVSPEYEISFFVQNNVASDGSPHLQIKSEVRKTRPQRE